MTITDFLLARIAEDEAAARDPWLHVLADVKKWWDANEDEPGFYADDQPDDVKGLAKTLVQIEVARRTYRRALAECAAKRRIVEMATYLAGTRLEQVERGRYNRLPIHEVFDDFAEVIQALASVYADHPDYRPEWA